MRGSSALPTARACAGWILTCLVCIAPALAHSELAGQSRRKGFILNLGLGPTMTAANTGSTDIRFGLGTDFIIGHAASDQVMIYYSNDAAFFIEPAYPEPPGGSPVSGVFAVHPAGLQRHEDRSAIAGLSAVGVTYFLRPQAPSFYLNGALGFASWIERGFDESDSRLGPGLAMGGGYEFARHWLVDVNIVLGRPGGNDGPRINTGTLRVGLTWLAY